METEITPGQCQHFLKEGMLAEQRKAYNKAIAYYRDLLSLVQCFPTAEYGIAESEKHRQLIFDCHVRLCICYDHVRNYDRAFDAIKSAVTIARQQLRGCAAGCVVPKSYQVPAIALRGCLHAKRGNLTSCLHDLTDAIIMDENNKDHYCLRSIAYQCSGEMVKAVEDAGYLVNKDAKSVPGLLLRGLALQELETEAFEAETSFGSHIFSQLSARRDLTRARDLDPLSACFMNPPIDFLHPQFHYFVARYLPTLRVPHLVTSIDESLFPESGVIVLKEELSYHSPQPLVNVSADNSRPIVFARPKGTKNSQTVSKKNTSRINDTNGGEAPGTFLSPPSTPNGRKEKIIPETSPKPINIGPRSESLIHSDHEHAAAHAGKGKGEGAFAGARGPKRDYDKPWLNKNKPKKHGKSRHVVQHPKYVPGNRPRNYDKPWLDCLRPSNEVHSKPAKESTNANRKPAKATPVVRKPMNVSQAAINVPSLGSSLQPKRRLQNRSTGIRPATTSLGKSRVYSASLKKRQVKRGKSAPHKTEGQSENIPQAPQGSAAENTDSGKDVPDEQEEEEQEPSKSGEYPEEKDSLISQLLESLRSPPNYVQLPLPT